MPSPLDVLPAESRARLRARPFPRWMSPMLAVLTDRHFSHPDWIFEPKLDGIRLLAFRGARGVRLMTRNRLDRSGSYPTIARAMRELAAPPVVLDGEVVAFDQGRSDFQLLQTRLRNGRAVRLSYWVFDVIYYDGWDLSEVPLLDRKRLLRSALDLRDPLRRLTYRREHGERLLDEACRKGWEGLIAKHARSPYEHARSRHWLKFKCVTRQEFVIGGYTDPEGARVGFGALLVGVYDGEDLRYAGKVGTGFDTAALRDLRRRMRRLERADPPFDGNGLPRSRVHWVRPELVCEVGFTEWTRDGRLRHPRFMGLRDDKHPREVVRERPA